MTARSSSNAGLPSALLLMVGCTFDFGSVGPMPGGGGASGGGGDGGSGGAPLVVPCDPSECVPIPDGFTGAVLFVDGESCSQAATVFEAFAAFSGDAATCGCDCVPASTECALPPMGRAYAQGSCNIPSPQMDFSLASPCPTTPLINGVPPRSFKLLGAPTPPECVSDEAPPNIPDRELSAPVRGCELVSSGCVDGSVCGARPAAGATCFVRELASLEEPPNCPAGLNERFVYRPDDLDDSRDCRCQCDAQEATCKEPKFTLYPQADCDNDTVLVDAPMDDCHQPSPLTTVGSVQVQAGAQVVCGAPRAMSDGQVTASSALQLCCLP